MHLTVIPIALLTFVSTMLGGLFTLRYSDKLHRVLGLSAGAVLGVAFFDLLPGALDLGSKFSFDADTITSVVAAGFLAYLMLDRFVFFHVHGDAGHDHAEHSEENTSPTTEHGHARRGILGASSLCLHSLMDGIEIGLAFQVSPAIGALVSVAVLAHDFFDGLNTVNMVLKNKGTSRHAFFWLVADAVAPVLGASSTLFFQLPEKAFGLVLAVFAGFFFYIGASMLVPESHHAHPKLSTTVMTVFGMVAMYFIIKNAI